MRFVPIAKARGLEYDQEVFTIDTDGKHGIAKMVEEKKGKSGRVIVFEVPQYFNAETPVTEARLITNVAFVSVPKAKKEKVAPEAGAEGDAAKKKGGKGGAKKETTA